MQERLSWPLKCTIMSASWILLLFLVWREERRDLYCTTFGIVQVIISRILLGTGRWYNVIFLDNS
jgi:hypothetical protein